MDVKTYRARSFPDALRLIWKDLGPEATVLSTQHKPRGLFGRLTGRQEVEVVASGVASATIDVEPGTHQSAPAPQDKGSETLGLADARVTAVPPPDIDYRSRFRQFACEEQPDSLLEMMIHRHEARPSSRLPSSLFALFTDLLEAEVDDRFARDLVEEVRCNSAPAELSSSDLVRNRATSLLLKRMTTAAVIEPDAAKRQVVALIGPTGVGKTTTIAKLAANLRLRDKSRVGLITVDTYRIAAVDQLRAYADIIDLPMEVVTTPREMRDAVAKLADLDIVLIDTAGRSHQDKIQIQELKAMLSEARADEVHLVLSSVGHSRHLTRVVEHFRPTNPTALLLTKLDEATCRGNLLPLLCEAGLPISYTTHGQSVPDDIQPADPPRLIEPICLLGTETMVMQDQASPLRRLVSCVPPGEGESLRPAHRVVLTGCKGGVGTTTLSINLAVALRAHAERILLVDANESRGDLAALCRLRGRADLADVLVGRCSIQEVMQSGPAGIRIVPRFGIRDSYTIASCTHLDRHLQPLAHLFDYILIDSGCSLAVAESLWPTADQALMVTTTDNVAVMDAYALIKSLARKQAVPQLATIVNRFAKESSAIDVQNRLSDSCRRFLRLDVQPLGRVPADMHVGDSAVAGRPLVTSPPGAPAARAIVDLAARLSSLVGDGSPSSSLTA